MSLTLQPASTPADTTVPETADALLQFFTEYMRIIGGEVLTGVTISQTQPAIDAQSNLWARLASGGRFISLNQYNGEWKPLPTIAHPCAEATLPSTPQAGELITRTDRGNAIEAYLDGAWVQVRTGRGATVNRPTSVPNGYRFFDTDIEREIKWVSAQDAWATVEGSVGESKSFTGVSLATILTRWPGWIEDTAMAGRYARGAGTDLDGNVLTADTTGGRNKFLAKIKRQQINSASAANVVGTLNIDGTDLTSPDTVQTDYGTATQVSVLDPYIVRVFIKKSFG